MTTVGWVPRSFRDDRAITWRRATRYRGALGQWMCEIHLELKLNVPASCRDAMHTTKMILCSTVLLWREMHGDLFTVLVIAGVIASMHQEARGQPVHTSPMMDRMFLLSAVEPLFPHVPSDA